MGMKHAYHIYPGVNGHGPQEWRAVPNTRSDRVHVVVIHEGEVYFRSDLVEQCVATGYSMKRDEKAAQLLRGEGFVPKTCEELGMPTKARPGSYSFYTADQAMGAMQFRMKGYRLVPHALTWQFMSLVALMRWAMNDDGTPKFKEEWAKVRREEGPY